VLLYKFSELYISEKVRADYNIALLHRWWSNFKWHGNQLIRSMEQISSWNIIITKALARFSSFVELEASLSRPVIWPYFEQMSFAYSFPLYLFKVHFIIISLIIIGFQKYLIFNIEHSCWHTYTACKIASSLKEISHDQPCFIPSVLRLLGYRFRPDTVIVRLHKKHECMKPFLNWVEFHLFKFLVEPDDGCIWPKVLK
jgi:hypothetical protein